MQKDFTFQLIKGKIGEIIFDQMFREAQEFTVIPFGYESTVPGIAQYARSIERTEVLDAIRNTPDFAIISHNQKQVFLVEVKYRSYLNLDEVLKTAQKIHDRWKLAWLFVATPTGFYFESCSKILDITDITPLSTTWVSDDLQKKYLEVMNKFKVE